MYGAGSGKYNRLPQLFQPGCFLLFLCPFMFLCLCLCFVIAGSLSICLSPFGESWSHFDPVCAMRAIRQCLVLLYVDGLERCFRLIMEGGILCRGSCNVLYLS
jgi:hypothetical protein